MQVYENLKRTQAVPSVQMQEVPREPMGEAWFMGTSRSMYDWLYGDIAALSMSRAERALEAIASGTSSFGWYAECVGAFGVWRE